MFVAYSINIRLDSADDRLTFIEMCNAAVRNSGIPAVINLADELRRLA